MAREIKFRAWDGNRIVHFSNLMIGIGKGYLPDRDEAVRDKEPYVYFTEDTFNGEVSLGTHEIMQYIGLKDKHGKEIYEGDIITCWATQREIHDVLDKDEKVVVKYNDGYFYPFGYNAGWRSEVSDVEVIGNIHENPELLNA